MNMKADPEEEGIEFVQQSIEDPDLFIGLPEKSESHAKIMKKLVDQNNDEKNKKGPLH